MKALKIRFSKSESENWPWREIDGSQLQKDILNFNNLGWDIYIDPITNMPTYIECYHVPRSDEAEANIEQIKLNLPFFTSSADKSELNMNVEDVTVDELLLNRLVKVS